MTVSLFVALPFGARADEHATPPSLMTSALQRSTYCDPPPASGRAVAWARLVPQLRLRAIVQQMVGPTRAAVENIAMAELAWPLDRTPAGDAVAAARDVRQRAEARESLVARVGEAWHQREQALERADDLATDEAEAELDALTGEIDP